MNDNVKDWRTPWWVWVIVAVLIAGLPGGPILAWYYDNPYWMLWTVVSVIAGLAGC